MIEMAINKQVSKWRRSLSPFLPYFMEYSEGKKLELWGAVFSSLWPWYGFSIPMVSYHRFGMILETHTAPSSLLVKDGEITFTKMSLCALQNLQILF